jgi:hypothetical protein
MKLKQYAFVATIFNELETLIKAFQKNTRCSGGKKKHNTIHCCRIKHGSL